MHDVHVQGNRRRAKPLEASEYKPSWPLHMLPSTVDWRGSPADSVIKDQAMCGSCWSFAAVAPMESAFFRHYGVQRVAALQVPPRVE